MLTLKSYQPGSDDWLTQAVIISWFSDSRASNEDELPDSGTDRRGFWGDMFDADYSLGSLLWLLRREKLTTQTLNRARNYAREALLWLLETPWVTRIEVDVSRENNQTLSLIVRLYLPANRTLLIQKEWINAA